MDCNGCIATTILRYRVEEKKLCLVALEGLWLSGGVGGGTDGGMTVWLKEVEE